MTRLEFSLMYLVDLLHIFPQQCVDSCLVQKHLSIIKEYSLVGYCFYQHVMYGEAHMHEHVNQTGCVLDS